MPVFEAFEDAAEPGDLAGRLADPDPALRRIAVIELGDTSDPTALPPLLAALQDEVADVRLQAAQALEAFDGPDAAAGLAAALSDADSRVAEAAATSLAELKDPAAAPAMLPRKARRDNSVDRISRCCMRLPPLFLTPLAFTTFMKRLC